MEAKCRKCRAQWYWSAVILHERLDTKNKMSLTALNVKFKELLKVPRNCSVFIYKREFEILKHF